MGWMTHPSGRGLDRGGSREWRERGPAEADFTATARAFVAQIVVSLTERAQFTWISVPIKLFLSRFHALTLKRTNLVLLQPSWAYSALSGVAGAVLMAKTATGELAWGDTWFDNITTRNPWNVGTGSCGSSAGSAAAVSAGRGPVST
jgi:hypothetical protein